MRGRERRRPVERGAPPAVVMGLPPGGLAVARSLGRAGVHVIGMDASRPAAAYSRHLRYVRADAGSGREIDPYLRVIRSLPSPPVLLPTSDANALLIARHADELAECARFISAPESLVEALVSKPAFSELARRKNLPVPRTVIVDGEVAARRAAERLSFPCIVKPENAGQWAWPSLERVGLPAAKAFPVEGPEALVALYERLSVVTPSVVAQEMVVGPDANHLDYHALIDASGEIRAEFIGRKLRLTPPHFGMGTFVTSVEDPETVALGRRVTEAIGCRGVVNINFKRDSRSGEVKLFEVNPRFSLWTGLDVACGVDLPLWFYLACLGRGWTAPAPTTRSWVHLTWDLRSMREYSRDGSLTWPAWARSLLRRPTEATFSLHDPAPAIAEALRLGRKHLVPRVASALSAHRR